jgi:hypothetical protein
MIDDDIKKDATALMWTHIEEWWRVNGHDPASREYDPVVGDLLRKFRITLPFTIDDDHHHNDELRTLTHSRGSKLGKCICYLCLIAEQKTELDRLVWDTMRAREAKSGRIIASWDQINESRTAKELPVLPPSFVENITRSINVPTQEDIMYFIKMLEYVSGLNRPLQKNELDGILNALVVPHDAFKKESLREGLCYSTLNFTPVSSVAAANSALSTPATTAKKSSSSATSAYTATATASSHSRRSVAARDTNDVCDGEDGGSGSRNDAAMYTILDAQETPVGRPKRK